MTYHIEIKEIEPIRVAYMKYKGFAQDANQHFPAVFKAIRGKADGAPLFHYLSIHPDTKDCELELCVPTGATPQGKGIEVKELPRIKALCVTHTGPYNTLPQAYLALETYAKEHDIIITLPYRERYIKGPGLLIKGNPKNYITEIQMCIAEE